MKERLMKLALAVTMLGLACFTAYHAGKSTVYGEQNEYFDKTEALLDSINNWNPGFIDTVMETDAYYEYEVARDKIL